MDPKLDGVAVYIYRLLVSDYLPIEITVLVDFCLVLRLRCCIVASDCLLIRFSKISFKPSLDRAFPHQLARVELGKNFPQKFRRIPDDSSVTV